MDQIGWLRLGLLAGAGYLLWRYIKKEQQARAPQAKVLGEAEVAGVGRYTGEPLVDGMPAYDPVAAKVAEYGLPN